MTGGGGDVGNAMLEVPYMNCSDAHKGKVLSCNWFDRGPDYFELTKTKLENYWNYYIVTHFRRGKATFSGSSAIMSAYSTFVDISDVFKQWVVFFYGKPAANQQVVHEYNFDPQFQDYWTMAVLDGINQHLNVMATPPFVLCRPPAEPLLWAGGVDSQADDKQHAVGQVALLGDARVVGLA